MGGSEPARTPLPETSERRAYDAIVIGSGPNGLAAAITLARAGCTVLVYEGKETVGGGARSAPLTLPGFVHDVCSAIHPLAGISRFFRGLPLHEYGLEWLYSPAALAHPFDDGTTALLDGSIELTGQTLGKDAAAYRQLMAPLVASWDQLEDFLLGPLQAPRHPLALLRFGLRGLRSARALAERLFTGERARGFFNAARRRSAWHVWLFCCARCVTRRLPSIVLPGQQPGRCHGHAFAMALDLLK
jgi:phytoene dehydrogenase-like protein